MEILKVENLCKTYGVNDTEVRALDNVSFFVERGEFVAIIGASGSGKSTLLHLIGGVDKATSGKIYIDGTEISELNQDKMAIFRRRQLGLVYQFYNLIPILTVEENIVLPCRLDGKQVEKEKLEEMLSILNLTDRRGHLPNQLSGGQQQRVSIGRALINHPAIVLADEPTGNLDDQSKRNVEGIFKKMHDTMNKSILLVTHDIDFAKLSETCYRIKNGLLILD